MENGLIETLQAAVSQPAAGTREHCTICRAVAEHKVGEEIAPGDVLPPGLRGHNATAYLCKRCFRLVMGWAPELVQDVAGVDWDEHAIRVDTMPRLVCAGDKVVYLAYVRETP